MCKNKEKFPFFYEIIKQLLTQKNTIIFVFSAYDDIRVIEFACEKYNLPYIKFGAYDLEKIVKINKKIYGALNKRCEMIGVDIKDLNHHQSLDDAIMTMRLFKKFIQVKDIKNVDKFLIENSYNYFNFEKVMKKVFTKRLKRKFKNNKNKINNNTTNTNDVNFNNLNCFNYYVQNNQLKNMIYYNNLMRYISYLNFIRYNNHIKYNTNNYVNNYVGNYMFYMRNRNDFNNKPFNEISNTNNVNINNMNNMNNIKTTISTNNTNNINIYCNNFSLNNYINEPNKINNYSYNNNNYYK